MKVIGPTFVFFLKHSDNHWIPFVDLFEGHLKLI
jgi:hypothetical protein